MANIKSAKKRIKVIKKKKENNNTFKTSMRTSIKKLEKLISDNDKKNAEINLLETIKKIDNACSKGVIKKNTASRYKSNLTKKVNALK